MNETKKYTRAEVETMTDRQLLAAYLSIMSPGSAITGERS